MKKIITLLVFSLLLYSCGNKIKDCDYEKVAEEVLDREANHIWDKYNGDILYLGAHVLNKNEAIKLLELTEYHKTKDNCSKIRKAIENGYPVIELYYEYDGYSKQNYPGNVMQGSYWQYEGNQKGTVYRYWLDYESCPCGEDMSLGVHERWEYNYFTFFGLTPLFKSLINDPSEWELNDVRNIYSDFNKERIFEYERDTTLPHLNVNWSKWRDLNDSKFFQLISEDENSFYTKKIK